MDNPNVSNSEKLLLGKKSISSLELASGLDSNNPSIWFMLGEVYDDVYRANHQKPKLALTKKKSSSAGGKKKRYFSGTYILLYMFIVCKSAEISK